MITTSATELLNNKTESGKAIGKLVKNTPYIPPATGGVPPSSEPSAPPIPTGAGE